MARMEDMPDGMRRRLEDLECPSFDDTPFVSGPPLSERRVALISTAGLQRRSDQTFGVGAADYRVLPTAASEDIVMSHISTNFDRTGFQQDLNVVFPLDRLRELAAAGVIGSAAEYHYSYMGATDPEQMRAGIPALADLLKRDAVDAVVLIPV